MIINVVLVRPIFSANVGFSARALANMGGKSLILINPKAQINSKAKRGAAGAQEFLNTTIIYNSWEDFMGSEAPGLRIGFTCRGGRLRKTFEFDQVIEAEKKIICDNKPLYLIFGPEDDGLNTDDLTHVNYSCSLPVFGDFNSLNLSQAVLLATFILRDRLSSQEILSTEKSAIAVECHTFIQVKL